MNKVLMLHGDPDVPSQYIKFEDTGDGFVEMWIEGEHSWNFEYADIVRLVKAFTYLVE